MCRDIWGVSEGPWFGFHDVPRLGRMYAWPLWKSQLGTWYPPWYFISSQPSHRVFFIMLRRKFVFQRFNCIPFSWIEFVFPSFPFPSHPFLPFPSPVSSDKFTHKFTFYSSNRSFLFCYIFRLFDPPSPAYPAGFISISSLFPLPYLSFVIEETSGKMFQGPGGPLIVPPWIWEALPAPVAFSQNLLSTILNKLDTYKSSQNLLKASHVNK